MTFDPDKPMTGRPAPEPAPAYHPSVEHLHSKPLILVSTKKAAIVRGVIEILETEIPNVEPRPPIPAEGLAEIDAEETPKPKRRKARRPR